MDPEHVGLGALMGVTAEHTSLLDSNSVHPRTPFYPRHFTTMAFQDTPSRATKQYAPGIPTRVADYADTVKRKFEDNATTSFIRERTESAEELPILPPGITRQKFNAAIEELRGLVDGHVELHDTALDDGWYLHRPITHDAYPLRQDDTVSSAACCPANVAQVQAVVRWANKWLIPISPLSMGRNLGKPTF